MKIGRHIASIAIVVSALSASYLIADYFDVEWPFANDPKGSSHQRRGEEEYQKARKLYALSRTEHSKLADAVKYYRMAHEKGHPLATCQLGYLSLEGIGVNRDINEAVSLTLSAAKIGIPRCQFTMGQLYLKGKGVDYSPEKATKWFQRAAAQGFSAAKFKLAKMYLEGRAINLNRKDAVAFLEEAAESGVAEAQGELGRQYMIGDVVKQDYVLGYYWTSKAAAQEHPTAIKNLNEIEQRLSTDELNRIHDAVNRMNQAPLRIGR